MSILYKESFGYDENQIGYGFFPSYPENSIVISNGVITVTKKTSAWVTSHYRHVIPVVNTPNLIVARTIVSVGAYGASDHFAVGIGNEGIGVVIADYWHNVRRCQFYTTIGGSAYLAQVNHTLTPPYTTSFELVNNMIYFYEHVGGYGGAKNLITSYNFSSRYDFTAIGALDGWLPYSVYTSDVGGSYHVEDDFMFTAQPGGIYFYSDNINPFLLYVNNYTPITIPALKWTKKSDNNYSAIDRGASNDVYRSEITIHGTEAFINKFISEIESNRQLDGNVLTLSNFNGVDDCIFGADVDYTGEIDVTIIDYDKRPQMTLKGFACTFTLQAMLPTFVGIGSMPTLTPEIGYSGYSDRTIKKYDTYDGTFSYLDNDSDSGVFEGSFKLNTSDMISLRRYLSDDIRGSDMTITISGVSYPLGPNGATGSIVVKVLGWSDEMVDKNYWIITMLLAEVI